MAEFLKRFYDLIALKVSLELAGEDASLKFELQVTQNHIPTTVNQWTLSTTDIGCPNTLRDELIRGHRMPFRKPDIVLKQIYESVRDLGQIDEPLWIHLVKPYGFLGLVPWEQWLSSLEVPILRLPDVIADPPREAPSTLDVIVCTSSPLAKEEIGTEQYVVKLLRQVLRKPPRPKIRFEVFTDKERVDRMRRSLYSAGLIEPAINIHAPERAASYAIPRRSMKIDDPIQDLENPWLLWMRNAIKGRSVDMVHFICHGYFNGDRGALAFAQSPTRNEDSQWSRFVGKRELSTFLTQVGAWSAAFSSPEENYSDAGLRFFADGLAQDQPGAILYHDWTVDRDGSQLAGAYDFLFQVEPGIPQRWDGLFLYCQPFRIKGRQDARPASYSALTNRIQEPPEVSSALASSFSHDDALPDWMAAAARYLERCEWNLNKAAQISERLGISTLGDDDAIGVNNAIGKIKRAMARIASRPPGGFRGTGGAE